MCQVTCYIRNNRLALPGRYTWEKWRHTESQVCFVSACYFIYSFLDAFRRSNSGLINTNKARWSVYVSHEYNRCARVIGYANNIQRRMYRSEHEKRRLWLFSDIRRYDQSTSTSTSLPSVLWLHLHSHPTDKIITKDCIGAFTPRDDRGSLHKNACLSIAISQIGCLSHQLIGRWRAQYGIVAMLTQWYLRSLC